jgi:hypothetical protein
MGYLGIVIVCNIRDGCKPLERALKGLDKFMIGFVIGFHICYQKQRFDVLSGIVPSRINKLRTVGRNGKDST